MYALAFFLSHCHTYFKRGCSEATELGHSMGGKKVYLGKFKVAMATSQETGGWGEGVLAALKERRWLLGLERCEIQNILGASTGALIHVTLGTKGAPLAGGREMREIMALLDRQNPFHRFLRNAESKLLSLPSNPSVYPVRVQSELNPGCHWGHCRWHCRFGGLGVDT